MGSVLQVQCIFLLVECYHMFPNFNFILLSRTKNEKYKEKTFSYYGCFWKQITVAIMADILQYIILYHTYTLIIHLLD